MKGVYEDQVRMLKEKIAGLEAEKWKELMEWPGMFIILLNLSSWERPTSTSRCAARGPSRSLSSRSLISRRGCRWPRLLRLCRRTRLRRNNYKYKNSQVCLISRSQTSRSARTQLKLFRIKLNSNSRRCLLMIKRTRIWKRIFKYETRKLVFLNSLRTFWTNLSLSLNWTGMRWISRLKRRKIR